MAKIPLTIDPEYCADWGAWEGVRELVSNAKDAEDEDSDKKMHVQHLPRTSRLVIRTEKTVVDPSDLLVLGKSSKRGHSVRGRFGEGFAIGCLALTRAGHEVTFVNGDAKWRCEIVPADQDHPLVGSQLLTFWSRSVTPNDDFEITIEGITTEIWEAMRKLFLFLSPPPASSRIELEKGTLLLGEDFRGQVFARGVFVRHFDDLKSGYDLRDIVLDRDRRMVDEWELHNQLADLWNVAASRYPEQAARPLYEMAKEEGSPEAYHLRWRSDEKLLKAMKEQFAEEHGEDAVPVSSTAEAKEMKALGAQPKVVNNTLKELLGKAGLSAETTKAALEGTVTRRLDVSELSEKEMAALKIVETVCDSCVVVEFRGARTWTKPLDEDKLLGVDRRLLEKGFREILMHATAGEALRRKVDQATVLVDAMERVLTPPIEKPNLTTCDECGNVIRNIHPSGINKDHDESCSAYPHGDGESQGIPA